MNTYTKKYIGKGKEDSKFQDLVKITLKWEDFEHLMYEKEGKKYLTFEVSKLKEADEYGRTHTCFVTAKESAKPVKAEESKMVYPKGVKEKIASGKLKKIGTRTKKSGK